MLETSPFGKVFDAGEEGGGKKMMDIEQNSESYSGGNE